MTEPLADWVTLIANAGRVAFALESLTAMTMLDVVPTSAAVGTPADHPGSGAERGPHRLVGNAVGDHVSVGSDPVGWNTYVCPTTMAVGGVPEIVGGLLTIVVVAAVTWIKLGSALIVLPSLPRKW